jgi:uroporphyrinogen decarboxylase
MNKRERMLSLLENGGRWDYVPAGFFIHFDKAFHRGRGAIDKHLEFFRRTDMDFVKIQYENNFPPREEIRRAEDWGKMPLYGLDFYEDQLRIVKGVVEEMKKEELVIVTLYSPFMCAGHTVGNKELDAQIGENPEGVKKGMEVVTESLLGFARECVRLGVDGFYASTQGGEGGRFEDRRFFDECVRPYDLAIMEEIDRTCLFNILHICDYHYGYDDLTPFVGYPGQVVNCSLELGERELTLREAGEMFGRPFMGGVDRKGIVASGGEEEIRRMVNEVLEEAPDRFVLGADCTLPGDIDWERMRTAIDAAHAFERG